MSQASKNLLMRDGQFKINILKWIVVDGFMSFDAERNGNFAILFFFVFRVKVEINGFSHNCHTLSDITGTQSNFFADILNWIGFKNTFSFLKHDPCLQNVFNLLTMIWFKNEPLTANPWENFGRQCLGKINCIGYRYDDESSIFWAKPIKQIVQDFLIFCVEIINFIDNNNSTLGVILLIFMNELVVLILLTFSLSEKIIEDIENCWIWRFLLSC